MLAILSRVLLGVLVVALICLMMYAAYLAGRSNDETERGYYVRLALSMLALLGVVLVAIVWLMIRGIQRQLYSPHSRPRTEHVDAWAMAGQRYRNEDDRDDEDDGRSPSDPPWQ